jgi:hypothetical protein
MLHHIIEDLDILSYQLEISEKALRFLVDQLLEPSDDPDRLDTLAFILEATVSLTFSHQDNLLSVLSTLREYEKQHHRQKTYLDSEAFC